jgi:multidrug efflux pump subunit AcrA (membrane-fusion protein)
MDVVRVRRRPQVARGVLVATLAIAAAGAAAWSLPNLFAHRAAEGPSVASASIVIDAVTRGPLENDVSAAGIFAPDRVQIVASLADGVVAELSIRPGTHVSAGTTIARLENPDLNVAVVDAAAQLAAARADVQSAREEAAAARLDEDSVLRSARAEDARASVEARSDTELHTKGLIGDLQYRSAVIKSAEDHDLVAIGQSKISVGTADAAAKIAAAQARVEQLAAELAARQAQLQTLVVRAGAAGVVQSVAVDPGQRVTSGTEFARIADERDLKAVLQVAEGDLRGVAPGQRVRITTSDSGTAGGRVSRIAPAAQNGTVAVDVSLDAVPPGARADQNVDGTVVIDRTLRALSIARPASAIDTGRVELYKLDRDGTHAFRTPVTLASGSADRARVVGGLASGDRVIVSDTSSFTAPVLRITE